MMQKMDVNVKTMNKYVGRKKPYTEIGIRRLKCRRCGKKCVAQWSACANNMQYIPMCLDCDIEINRMVLEYFNIPNRKLLMKEYIVRKRNETNQIPTS